MKARNVLLGLLLGAIGLFPACSSNSPTAPPPSPTPVAFSISLTASPAETLVNGGILLTARVTSGGRDVPDNTSVTFTISSCVPNQPTLPGFGENMLVMTCETTRTTSAGVATATIWSGSEGTFEVVARVPGQTAKVFVTWKQPITPGTLAVYSVTPNRGRPEGGQQVVINGRGFAKPVTVDFIVGAGIGHAQVLDVNAAGTQITAITPPVAGTVTAEVVADVRVTAAAGTSGQVTDTLEGGYTYERVFGEPRIYAVDPPRGSWAGGAQVTISGANFFTDVRVLFGAEEAQVTSVSADKARITVFTPRHGGSLTQEQIVDVTVVTRDGTVQEQQVTANDAYTYVPDSGVPLLYSVVPSRGSPRGGETVVLSGKNFTEPVTVEFIVGPPVNATLPATVQSVSADGTRIVLTTPQASPQDLPEDTLASLRITNLVGSASSQNATFADVYTYTKESRALDVYTVFPNRGKATGGERVVIAGRGFVQPVKVDFLALGGERPAEVVEVNDTGTAIIVLTPAVPQQVTTEVVADVRVTAAAGTTIEQQATLAAAFTFERQFAEPRIFAVIPNKGSYTGGEQVTIFGANFFTPLGVAFGTEVVQVLSSTEDQIVVKSRPHPDGFITEELTVPVTVVTRFDTGLQQTVTKEDAYTYLPNTGVPLLYSVTPNRGSPRGGETVTLVGKNLHPPLLVEFIIGAPVGATLPASVISTDLNPDGTHTVRVVTPQASPDPLATDATTDIRITNLVGTAISQTATFTGVFVYDREAKDIVIYSVEPNRGKAEGGETVMIHGKGFVAPAQVDFIIGVVAYPAQVLSRADDLIVCKTPAIPESDNAEVTADVKVTAALGLPTQKEATLVGGFTFEKQFPAPQIYLISPSAIVENSPPYPVTIFGANFFQPVRVQLGAEDATVVSVSADGATIEILTPLHSGGPGAVNVTVYTRFETAQQQQVVRAGGFTWLPAIVEAGTPVIYSINPNRGSRVGGESVTIIGANLCTLQATATGFECVTPPAVNFRIGAPLSVDRAAQVVSYTPDGRQVIILTPQASPQPLAQDTYATVQVTNNTGTGELVDGFVYLRDETPVAIYSVVPNRGRPEGGQTVTISGRGFVGPIVNVDFITNAGGARAAEVVSFNAAGSEIVVKTPATGVDSSIEHVAAIRVTVAVGTANQKDVTLEGAFTYEKRYAAPLIYSVVPNKGSWAGGDTLTIIGANFLAPLRVTLGGEDAEVLPTSTEAVLQVRTPLHPNTHLTQELVVDVTVTTSFETAQQQQAVLGGGFTWMPDTGVPQLYSVIPNKGDPRGGETVILTGSNFTEPVTVEFLLGAPYGTTLPATVVSVNAAGTEITVRTPQVSPTPVTSEVVTGIRITNLVGSAFSQNATFQNVFTYESESNLAIYSVTPNRGKAEGGDTVQILGRGFIAPVHVDFIVNGQARAAEVMSITGDTEIVVQTPATGLDSTTERIADVQVTVAAGTANQIVKTLPASFTYEKFFGAPAIYAVIPDRGSWAGNEVVTIVGAAFYTPVRVFFGAEEATVDTGASTTTTLVVRTPQHLQGHLAADLTVDVRVQTRFDTAQQQEVVLAGAFTWKPDTGVPLLYSVSPNRGDPRGGETITLTGKNFTSPVTVEFILGAPVGATYSATVLSIDTAGGVMTVRTPQASPSPLTQEVEVDFRITNLVGSASSQNATFLKVFTYNTESDLAIYTVTPNRGSPSGGQTVEIRGRGFIPTVNVHFLVAGQERQAEVVAVTDGGARIEIRTPASNVDATIEHIADVRVTVAAGTANQKSTSLLASYTYEKQFAAPAIYAIVPNRGSHAGNETVTIFGSGFFTPVRVLLGAEVAEVVVADSTETKIVIKTPTHNPSHLTSDLTVDVTVFTRYETAQQQQAVLPGGFTWVPDSGAPILYSVIPNRGSPRGGEDVQLIGRNFTAPVTVDFILGAPLGTTLPATVVGVTTNPDGTQTIAIKTPQASPTPVTTDVVTDIRITNLVGSSNSETATFQGVFTYEGESRAPIVYFVEPDKGSPRGGETVTVYGRFFLPPVRVQFTFTANGVTKTVDAEFVSLNADGTEITVITPTASLEPLQNDAPADIRVTTQYSTGRDQFATLPEGFLYLAEQPTPEMFSLSPNSGPIEGGTRVTITGAGFQYPVQVFFTIPVFGAIQAQVVSVNFSQVVVITPSITPMEPDTPTIAQVTAINMTSGKISNALTFRYGNAMFISAVAPNEGPDLGGTMVTIFGQGFVAPVAVTLAGVPAQILTVAGTEIVVKALAPTERACEPITGPVSVTNIDSNLSADGPSFTYRPARPLITSVEVFSPQVPPGSNIVREYDPTRPAPCSTNDAYPLYTVIVRGENFEQYANSTASAMSVIFENPDVEVLTTWVSANEVRFTLPDLSAVVLDTAACTINGAPGLRDIPTGIPFTIRNNNNLCEDTLDPAIILEPCDPNCRAGIIQVNLSPATLNLGIGTTATMTACISAVQTGATNVTISTSGSNLIVDYSLDGIVFAPGIVLVIPPGQVCETFTIRGLTGGAVGTVAQLDVSLGGSTDVSQITVGALTIALSPSSLNLPVGGTGLLTIQLSAPAPAGGAPVLVAQAGPIGKISFGPLTGNCTNPPAFPLTVLCSTLVAPITSFTVVIPAGSSTYTFPVNGLNASPPGPVTVSATLDPSLGGAAAISSVLVGQFNVTLSPSAINIPVGGTGTFTVSLDAPAYDFDPAANICGIQVQITQTGPGGVITFTADPDNTGIVPCGTAAPVTAPTGAVTINTGTQIATFTVNGISGGGPVTVTVSLPAGVGGATASSTVTVSTYILTLTPESLLIPLGTDGNFIVTLNAPAPAIDVDGGGPLPVGAPIYISQVGQVGIIEFRDSTGAAVLPGTPPNGQYVVIPPGATSAAFRVRGLSEGGPIVVTTTLHPSLGTSSDSSTVSVGTLTLTAQPTTLTVPMNGSNTFILTLSKAQTAPTTVNLASSNGAVAYLWDTTVPPVAPPVAVTSVIIPANSLTSPPVGVYGVNLGPATIYASLGASLGGSTAQVAVQVTQAIQFVPASLTVPVGSQGTFTLQVAAAQGTPTNILLDFSGTSGAVAGETQALPPSSIVLPAGSNTVSFNVWGMKPTATAVSVVATLPNTLPAGLAGATAVGTVTVSGAPYALTFNPATINLPVGASTNMAASFNYPLPPAYTGLTYPVQVQLAMSAPGSSVIFIQGNAATGNDIYTWTNPLQTAADSVRTIDAQANGGPVTITGVGPAAIGSPIGTATATVGPATTTLTMSPSPFMWTHFGGPPAPGGPIGLFISPIQATPTIVQLQSSNPAVVQVPSTAIIPAGSASVTFPTTIVSTGTATITATIPPPPAPAGVSAAAASLVTVNSITVFDIELSPASLSIPAGGTGTITFTLSDPLPVSLPGVTLTGFNGAVISVPSPVTIPAGVTTYDVTVTALAPGGPTSITGTMPASVGGAVLGVTPAVTVDPLTFTLSVGTNTLYVGSSTTATVETALPVPSDTLVTISEPAGTGDLTVPATATIPSGTTTASFTVTGLTLGGPRTLQAALPASLSATPDSEAITIADLPLTLTPNPGGDLFRGTSVTVTAAIPAVLNADAVVSLTQAGGSGGVLILPVPPSVTIPAGSLSATFPLLPGATNGTRNLRGTLPAALNASAAPHDLTQFNVADQVLTLAPDPLNMAPNSTAPMTATLSSAPLADAIIALVSNDPGLFTVPATITIPAGNTSTSFNVTALASNGSDTIDGTLPAALTLAAAPHYTATVNINGLSVELSPTTVNELMAGSAQLFTVTIDAPVAQDVSVQLLSSSPNTVSVPASVVIPAGATSVTFQAIGETVIGGSVDIDAILPSQWGGDTDTATINSVIPLTIAVTPSVVDLASLTERTITVTTGAIMAKEMILPLSSLNPIMAALFDLNGVATGSVVIPIGGSSASFVVRGLAQGFTAVDVNIPLIYGGIFSQPEAQVVVRVTQLQLLFAPSTLTVPHGGTGTRTVFLRDLEGNPVTVAVPATINVTSANPSVVFVVTSTVVIPAGGSSQIITVLGSTPGGPVTVTAQLDPSVGGATAVLEVGVSFVGPPTISSVSPSAGPTTGGTNVTINGTLFWSSGTVFVYFDGIPATNVLVLTPGMLTCTTPPHAAGAVTVQVINPDATTGSLASAFTYVVPGTATITLNPNPLVWHTGAPSTTAMTIGISPVQGTATTITLLSSNGIVANPAATVIIPASTATATFDPFGSATVPGTASITATLPASLGSGTASGSVTHFGTTFTPTATTVPVGSSVDVAMSSTTSLPIPINVAVAQTGGADTVSVPSLVTLPAGSTVDIPVTGLTSVGADAIVGVTFAPENGNNSIASAFTVDVGAPSWTYSPVTPVSIPMGGTQQFSITLGSALPGDTTFLLSAGVTNFTFPPSVTIPAGQLSATFDVAAAQLGGPNPLTITPPAGFAPGATPIAITVTDVTLQITPSTVGPLMAGGGQTFILTISQAQTAPFDITLSTDSARFSVPASVPMPAGQTTTTFVGVAESTGGLVNISASLPSVLNNNATPHATAIVTSISALTIAAAPTSVNIPAASDQAIVVTTGVTLAKDVTLTIASADPVRVGVFPGGSITILKGTNTGTFNVRGLSVGSGINVRLDTPVALGGLPTSEADVTVTVLALQIDISPLTLTIGQGGYGAMVVNILNLPPGGVVVPVTVNLTSDGIFVGVDDDTNNVPLPTGASSVVIPVGTSTQTFYVYGLALGGPTQVTASLIPAVGGATAFASVGVFPGFVSVASVTPPEARTTGYTGVVTIIGSGFLAGATVTFGGTPEPSCIVGTPSVITCTAIPAHVAGNFNVVVTNPGPPPNVGTYPNFQYYAVPTSTGIVPPAGGTAGGTNVVISGSFLVNGTYTVSIGGSTCGPVNSSVAGLLSCVTGPRVPEGLNLPVSITDEVGQVDPAPEAFDYYDPPTTTTIVPDFGTTGGGDAVTINGNFLAGGAYTVDIGGSPCTVGVVGALTITCTTTAHAAALDAVVTVIDDAGQSAATLAFDFYPPPTTSGITPGAGPTAGGTPVVISGTFLAGGTYTVDIGGSACAGPVATATTITCTTGPHVAALGAVVTVTDADSQSDATQTFDYYAPLPATTGIVPDAGSTAGGTGVTINGTFLNGGSYTVDIGGSACTGVAATGIQITCTTGPHTAVLDATVTVTDAILQSDSSQVFDYLDLMAVTSIQNPLYANQAIGRGVGGEVVTINGSNFLIGATYDVLFVGSPPAIPVVAASTTQLQVTTPSNAGTGASGFVNVTVTDALANVASVAGLNDFAYYGAPSVSNIQNPLYTNLARGQAVGGETVNVNWIGGDFLLGGTYTVTFGANAPSAALVALATQLQVATPNNGSSGFVNAIVTDATNQTASIGGSSDFAFYATPTVTSVAAGTGIVGGGTLVNVTGTGFVVSGGTYTVTFDPTGTPAACTGTVTSSTVIQCTTSAHVAGGPYPIQVVDPLGQSGTSGNIFTYTGAALTLQITSSAATGGTISDGTNSCAQAAGGGTNTCGAYAVSSSPLSMTLTPGPTAYTWGGACAGCVANTTPCALNVTTTPLTCAVTITAP